MKIRFGLAGTTAAPTGAAQNKTTHSTIAHKNARSATNRMTT